ncbi:MAG: hypothetical protein ACLRSW_09465 [Christensenellaceae bacterium]
MPEEMLVVPMDATLIMQVIGNILSNAVKYTSEMEISDKGLGYERMPSFESETTERAYGRRPSAYLKCTTMGK